MAVPRFYAQEDLFAAAYDGAIAIADGTLMYFDTDDFKPSTSMADAGTEDLNQRDFARRFAGVARDPKVVTAPAGMICIARCIDAEFDCVSATYEPGDLLALDEAASGTAMEASKLVKTTDSSIAVGEVLRRESAAVTRVRARLAARLGSRAVAGQPWTHFFRGTGVNSETLAGAKILVAADAPIQVLDPGGAGRNVDLPAATGLAGYTFTIHNSADAAEVLTVRLTGGGATVDTPTQNETAIFYCDGTTWRSIVGANN